MILESIKLAIFVSVIAFIIIAYQRIGLDAACFLGFAYLVGYFGRERFDDFVTAYKKWKDRR